MADWDRQPREPARWFARFQIYLQQGHDRSLDEAYAACQQATGKQSETRAPGSWKEMAGRWRWRDRALSYDEWQRKEKSRFAREVDAEHRKMVRRAWKVQLQASLEILSKAQLNNLDAKTARKLIPSAARLLQNALGGHDQLPKDPETQGAMQFHTQFTIIERDGTVRELGSKKTSD